MPPQSTTSGFDGWRSQDRVRGAYVNRVFADVLDPGGPAADAIDDLWWLMLALGSATFALFAVLLVRGALRDGSHAPPGDDESPSRSWLVGGGVVLPAGVVLVVLVATIVVLNDTPEEAAAGDDPLLVEAEARQWWWEFRYPHEDVVTANEVHVPVGRPVQLRLGSADVIHSFWVPELAGKRDALPDGVTSLVIQADRPGRYPGRCAEFCGLQHTYMDVTVVAHPAEDFRDWLASHRRPADEPTTALARRGRDVFLGEAAGCASCHAVRGTSADGERGPDLTHVADRARIAGGRLPNTPDDLRAFVHDPDEFKNGVKMPPADLPAEDVDAVVAYLEGLE